MNAFEDRLVELAEQPMDVEFHPSEHILATGLIDGHLQLFACGDGQAEEKWLGKAHEDACRAVCFSADGGKIISGSSDQSIAVRDLQEQKFIARLSDASDAAVNRLAIIDEWSYASGDDNGVVKTWDLRQKKPTMQFSCHSDSITGLTVRQDTDSLLASSGDGSFSVNYLKIGKVASQSDGDPDTELLSIVVIKHGRKVVCGSEQGSLEIFSWGNFEDSSDCYPGHPSSIDALLKLDEDTIITASEEGVIRIISIQPHNLVGIIGEQEEGGCERIAMSHDSKLLASTSYLPQIHLWNTSILCEDADSDNPDQNTKPADSDADSSDEDGSEKRRKRKNNKNKKSKKLKTSSSKRSSSFFSDLL